MATQLRRRAKNELLIKLVGSSAKIAADQTRVLGLGPLRAAKRSGEHHFGEPRSKTLKLRFDQFGHVFIGTVITGRHMSVAIQRVLTLGRP